MSPEYAPFFAYGTLLPGQPNAFLWGESVVAWQPAVLAGAALYDMGHFPMCVQAPAGSVQGQIAFVQPDQFAAIARRLDELEGYNPGKPALSPYLRLLLPVEPAGGDVLSAWVYFGKEQYVTGRPQIRGGDWLHYQADRLDAAQRWWDNYRADYFKQRS